MSLVIPAYNESLRLPPYLEKIQQYLSAEWTSQYEVIVVDDGSSDHLPDVLAALSRDWQQLKTIRHHENRGKGAAVRTGVLAAHGERILFADADGATPIEEEARLRAAIDAGADVAVGSRLVQAESTVRMRTPHRAAVGRVFAAAVRRVFAISVRDTQCGFKMFRGDLGRLLFGIAREDGYLFDIEILLLAERHGCRIVEVPINWSDQPGSRLHLWRAWPAIVAGLWRVRRRLAGKRENDGTEGAASGHSRDGVRG